MIETVGGDRMTRATEPPPGAGRAGLVVAVLMTAVNLRPAVVAVAPVLPEIQTDLGIGSAVAALLTTLPLVCFGLGSFVAPRLGRRVGMARALLGTMTLVVIAVLARLVPSTGVLFVGTLGAGLAIAVGNVLIPAMIRRDFVGVTVGRMLGAETVMISAGGALSAAVMVPLGDLLGWSWRPTLALWALPAAVAALLWVPRARGTAAAVAPGGGLRRLWRSPLAWAVTLLMGLQSLHFYAMTTWTPSLVTERGGFTAVEGGLLLALAGVVSLPANYVTPILAGRRASQHRLVVALVVLLAGGYVGLVVAPGLAVLWMVLVGLGQGVGLSLGHALITLRAADAESTSDLSAMAQGAGYVVAAAGPIGVGALHDATGGWTAPLVALLVMLVPMTVAGVAAARDRHVPGATS